MVGAPGFEPGTSCAQGKRATRLRHAPKKAGVRFWGSGARADKTAWTAETSHPVPDP